MLTVSPRVIHKTVDLSNPRIVNLTGRIFGKLIVLQPYGIHENRGICWECACQCGKKVVVPSGNLVGRNTQSCGCSRIMTLKAKFTTHGEARVSERSPEFTTWAGMKTRCTNPNTKCWPHYGGRGIKVCERWMEFRNFLSDMGRKPSPKHSLGRIDNDGNYEPRNCRWETQKQQQKNRRGALPKFRAWFV